jgi:hypothetical protein
MEETFTQILWWYCVVLFAISTILFYGTLMYALIEHVKDVIRRRLNTQWKKTYYFLH